MASIMRLFGKITDVDSTQKYPLGTTYQGIEGRQYVYGQYDTGTGGVTCHKFQILVPYAASNVIAIGKYTADITDSVADSYEAAVVSYGRHVTDGYWGWFGYAGKHAVQQGSTASGRVTDGGRVYVSADKTINMMASQATTGELRRGYFGVALENSKTTPTAVTMDILFYGTGYA
jgi:hypothetical protein